MATKYKRGKTWWGRAQREGREYRRSLKTTDSSEADRRLRAWVAELDKVAWGDRPARLFDEAVERFMNDHFPTLKASSQRRYKVSLINLAGVFAGKYLTEVKSATLSDFETARRSSGVSAPTIRRDLACLSSLMTSAVDWEWIDVNPVPVFLRRRKKRGLKEAQGRTRYLSHKEETALLAAASPSVRSAIAFAIDTGLRLEEQFSLTWERVDLNARRIALEARLTKSKAERLVPLFPRSAQFLAQLPRHIRSPYVFRHDDGGRLNNMEKGFKAAVRRAKLKDLRWHDLRRTCGCRLLQDYRQSMEQVRDILGHASVTTTENCYAFLNREKTVDDLTKPGTGRADSSGK